MRQARQSIARGELVVLPTDTVYGVGADAFSPAAVQRLLDAKGRGRQQPPPVLVANPEAMRALVEEVPEPVSRLVERFWPGALTIVLPAQPSLSWDLGETRGTVAVRMPDQRITLELLSETGPLAVSSANLTGKAAAVTIDSAIGMLGDSVAVYLDSGASTTGIASTIVDATSLVGARTPVGAEDAADEPRVRVLREGAVSRAELREVLGDLLEADPDEGPGDGTEPSEGAIEAVTDETGHAEADPGDADVRPGDGGGAEPSEAATDTAPDETDRAEVRERSAPEPESDA
jgi:tRNA threonylcarbamoyl adenosine modification protein (Sua5/YciO/YrdC/YwlC family)